MKMNRRERLMAVLNGRPADRPPVSFYEIDGSQDPDDQHPLNIYNHPSWRPLIELARAKTDRIVRREVPLKDRPADALAEVTSVTRTADGAGNRLVTTAIKAGRRVLTQRTKRDPDVDTVWTLEHFLKDIDDVQAWLDLPDPPLDGAPDAEVILAIERDLGEAGIAMVDMADPLCCVAELFAMADFTVFAMTEPELFRRMLDKVAPGIYRKTERVAEALPGRLWRIVGPEYASEPYLPPRLFHEYVTEYDRPLVDAIHKFGGFARLHCHGRLMHILDDIVATGCMGLDPIEPPPQGDVELEYVRRKYGDRLVLFGNLEASDIENLPPAEFAVKVDKALREGTSGAGRGFVLMPSACPYGRILSPLALANYELIIEHVERL